MHRYTAIASVFAVTVKAVNSGLAKTPQMGWVCLPTVQSLLQALTKAEQLEHLCVRRVQDTAP